MQEKTSVVFAVKPKKKIFFRIFANYAVMVFSFALVLGVIFMQLYQNSNLEKTRSEIAEKAEIISGRFEEDIRNEDYDGALGYLEQLMQLERYEVWTLSNPHASEPMDDSLVSVDLSGVALAEEQVEAMENALAGRSRLTTYYSAIHGCTLLTAAVPIRNMQMEVCGIVLLNLSMTELDETTDTILYLVLFSSLFALVVSGIFAFVFARQISRPISVIQNKALELARGNYEKKASSNRNDEIGVLAAAMDFLTDKLEENEIERKNIEQMRMDFFANVSHELRTPITVVRAYTESLVDGVVTDEKKYYKRILNECKSMERLVGDLLILSKMQNPDFMIEKEPVNLAQVLRETVKTSMKLAEEKFISVEFLYEEELYMMYGDYDRLRQMFVVIMDNAIKFSHENGRVYIKLSKQNGRLRVAIKDEGIGIAKEELELIFDKFYKSKLRQNAKGTGLGLAIARQIALRHDGQIKVESEPGKGTEFVFEFEELSPEQLSFEEFVPEDNEME